MTELSTSLETAESPELSTQLDEVRTTTEGTPSKAPVEEKAKPESRLDALKRAAADVEKANPAPKVEEPKEVKAEPEAKEPEAKADVEAPIAKEAEAPKETPRRSHIEAPAKFLPRAKELWQNVPHEVRSEMQRVMAETETEATQARESVKEYEAIKPYAEMARKSGTTIDQALGRYVQMEQTLRSDPAAGFRALAQNMQMTPVQMIGHIMAAHNVRPDQLAQHMANAPQEYTALARPQPQAQQPQSEARVETLEREIAALRQQHENNHVESTIIEPFAKENPRFRELEDTIASFLQSDIIPKGLSLRDRLAAAYDLAVRISPSAQRQPVVEQEQADEGRAGKDFGGDKSVRGAPASGMDTSSRSRGKMSRGDALKAAMSDLGLAH